MIMQFFHEDTAAENLSQKHLNGIYYAYHAPPSLGKKFIRVTYKGEEKSGSETAYKIYVSFKR